MTKTRDCHVIDEEQDHRKVASFGSVAECEQFIAMREKVEPSKVHRGGYGIDAPEDKTNRKGAR